KAGCGGVVCVSPERVEGVCEGACTPWAGVCVGCAGVCVGCVGVCAGFPLWEVVPGWGDVPVFWLYAAVISTNSKASKQIRLGKRKFIFITTPKNKWHEGDHGNTLRKIRSSNGWRG